MGDAVKGDGRTGLEGLVSELKVLIKDIASGIGTLLAFANVAALALLL